MFLNYYYYYYYYYCFYIVAIIWVLVMLLCRPYSRPFVLQILIWSTLGRNKFQDFLGNYWTCILLENIVKLFSICPPKIWLLDYTIQPPHYWRMKINEIWKSPAFCFAPSLFWLYGEWVLSWNRNCWINEQKYLSIGLACWNALLGLPWLFCTKNSEGWPWTRSSVSSPPLFVAVI